MIIFDNFITDIECNRLIQLYEVSNPVRSTVNRGNRIMYSNRRTSYHIVIHKKFDNYGGLPEHWKLIKYTTGQEFRTHTDLNIGHTVIIYLNNNNTGGTALFKHSYVVPVKKGRLLIFNSSESHAGTPVTGVKYILTGYIN